MQKEKLLMIPGPSPVHPRIINSLSLPTVSHVSPVLVEELKEALVNLKKIKKMMGVVPQEMAFYEELSAKENLIFWGKLQGVGRKTLEERIRFYLEKTGLLGRENDPLKK
ncbi:unnamed protein product, partial [marine sediment metagenome]